MGAAFSLPAPAADLSALEAAGAAWTFCTTRGAGAALEAVRVVFFAGTCAPWDERSFGRVARGFGTSRFVALVVSRVRGGEDLEELLLGLCARRWTDTALEGCLEHAARAS